MTESDAEAAPVIPPPSVRTSNATQALRAVVALARQYGYDPGHAYRVARLAAQLFEALYPLHAMDDETRFWLLCAAILHDMAKDLDQAHHTAALRIVLTTPALPFGLRARRFIGLIAR